MNRNKLLIYKYFEIDSHVRQVINNQNRFLQCVETHVLLRNIQFDADNVGWWLFFVEVWPYSRNNNETKSNYKIRGPRSLKYLLKPFKFYR